MNSKNRRTSKPKKRRAFGRVCRRANGRGWYAQFPDPSGARTANGRTRYVTRSVSTRREGEELLREVRTQLAIAYLRNTSISLDDIAYRLGFSDAANFRHAFKRWTGNSPGTYRGGRSRAD